ncbi:MAG: cation:proton antiporter [Proteobacteria bacterium]|nr:MAG: cation:proton antiporter [Pseudomonadota bacterium]
MTMSLDVLLILVLSVAFGWLARRFRFPVAVAQVLLGMLIGPPVLGWIEVGEAIRLFGELGVVLLLGFAGMELGVQRLADAGRSGVLVAILGIGLSWVAGYGVAIGWGSQAPEAVYVGIVLAATSVGISVQVLRQYGLIERRVGEIVLAAAVIDDVIALYLLAVAHGTFSKVFSAEMLGISLVAGIVLLPAIFWSGRSLFQSTGGFLLERGSYVTVTAVAVFLVIAGWATDLAGFSPVVGAFFAGLGVRAGFDRQAKLVPASSFEPLVALITPFFFIAIGSRADWSVIADAGMPLLLIGLVIAAFAGKVLGAMAGALSVKGWEARAGGIWHVAPRRSGVGDCGSGIFPGAPIASHVGCAGADDGPLRTAGTGGHGLLCAQVPNIGERED